jgi:hypothetical protein
MRAIWGSSSSNMYVVGFNDQNKGIMYHFDGNGWSVVPISAIEGGNISGLISFSDVFGFSSRDIYAVGSRDRVNPTPPPNFLDSNLIVHFDGTRWIDTGVRQGRELWSVAGNSQRNALAVGVSSTLFCLKNNNWLRDSINVFIPPDASFGLNSVSVVENGDAFALGNWRMNAFARECFFSFRRASSQWTLIDSVIVEVNNFEDRWGYNTIWASSSGQVYSLGVGVFTLRGNSWVRVYNTGNALVGISAVDEKNIFVVGYSGTVLHFDGNDWYQYSQFLGSGMTLTDVWTNGTEVFVVGHCASGGATKSFILRGK